MLPSSANSQQQHSNHANADISAARSCLLKVESAMALPHSFLQLKMQMKAVKRIHHKVPDGCWGPAQACLYICAETEVQAQV